MKQKKSYEKEPVMVEWDSIRNSVKSGLKKIGKDIPITAYDPISRELIDAPGRDS